MLISNCRHAFMLKNYFCKYEINVSFQMQILIVLDRNEWIRVQKSGSNAYKISGVTASS